MSDIKLEKEADEKFLDKIMEVYGDFSALELSTKTHKFDTPWYKVWSNVIAGNSLSLDIPEEDIREYYQNLFS